MHRVGEDRRGASVGYSRIMPNRQLVRAIRLLVMHGNRILDVADRITHLEGGRLSWFTTAVTAKTQHRMDLPAQPNRQGELLRHVAGMSVDQVARPLAEATAGDQRETAMRDAAHMFRRTQGRSIQREFYDERK